MQRHNQEAVEYYNFPDTPAPVSQWTLTSTCFSKVMGGYYVWAHLLMIVG